MAYTSVTDLHSDIQKYMNRSEASLVSKIPLWVSFAEGELDRTLRHPDTITTSIYSVVKGGRVIPAPTGLLELSLLMIEGSNEPLLKRSVESLNSASHATHSRVGTPTTFAAMGARYLLDTPVSEDTSFSLTYYKAPERLSVSSPNNLYLNALPDYLLFSSLAHGFSYDVNMEEAAYYRSLADSSLSNLMGQIQKETFAGSTLVTFSNSEYLTTYY